MGLLATFFSKDKSEAPGATLAKTPSVFIADGPLAGPGGSTLFSINKPVWSYGLESVPGILPEKKDRGRRILFMQLAAASAPDAGSSQARAEDDCRRLSCGLPLWLAEALFFSKTCTPAVCVALDGANHAMLTKPWSPEEFKLFAKSVQGSADYIATGTVAQSNGIQKITLDLWDVQKRCHRKTFGADWTQQTADTELTSFYEYFHLFMEWTAYSEGDGVAYVPARHPFNWIQILGTSLTFFLADKGVLDREPLALSPSTLDLVADLAVTGESASLAWLTLQNRALHLGKLEAPVPVQIRGTPLVKAAQTTLR